MTTALVGGQFGSEGKGLIAGLVGSDYDYHVRVGAANAGHTVLGVDGKLHVMQQVPCGAYTNPDARLLVGPGALISPEIFSREIDELDEWRRDRGLQPIQIWVDYRAHVITAHHIEQEAASDLAARIGSTSTIAREGIGVAQAERVMRAVGCQVAGDWFAGDAAIRICDVAHELWEANARDDSILLEGTQGTGLSLTTGFFPYTTSRNTTAAGLCADCGVAPSALDEVILVCRTFPIRVAGNSGPFHTGSVEINWREIGIDEEDERTTVTKKVRRVATFSIEQVEESVKLNGPTQIALTFCDYLDRAIAHAYGPMKKDELSGPVRALVFDIEHATGVPVTMLGTGPKTVITLT